MAPLMVLHLPLLSMKKYNDAVKFNLQFTSLDEIESMPDKLRWHRYHKGLYQFEVAEYLGVERQTYSGYEEPDRDFCPPEHIAKLTELYGVPAEDLTDEYNLFIYKGQGKQLIAKRKELGLTCEEYAARLGTSSGNLRKWEKDEVRMVKKTWERCFRTI
ncbi:MAG: helix-turn-helix domain-containing protein [Oscillospiraceae bacterium]|nr:helix-turn-helix domain-containing protein [Oscillospiraceae bacterium]